MVIKRKNALGKGIDALFNDVILDENNENIIQLEIQKIKPNPYQPRKDFSKKNLEELASSIQKNGIFQPIIVRSFENYYELIAGERRVRAAKIIGMSKVPAIVRNINDDNVAEISILENLQREDLNPIEEAQAYYDLMNHLNITQSELSERLGKSRPHISNYLRLLDLPENIKNFVKMGKLSMGQARTLLSLKDPNKLILLAKKTIINNYTVRQLEKIIGKQNKNVNNISESRLEISPHLKTIQDELQNKIETNVSFKHNSKTNKGKLEINYESIKDLYRILSILGITL